MAAVCKNNNNNNEIGHGFEVVRRAVPRSARKVSKMASKFLV